MRGRNLLWSMNKRNIDVRLMLEKEYTPLYIEKDARGVGVEHYGTV